MSDPENNETKGLTVINNPSPNQPLVLVPGAHVDLPPLIAACEKAKADLALLGQSMPTPELQQRVADLVAVTNPEQLGLAEENEVRWTVPSVRLNQATTTSADKPADTKPGDIFTTSSDALPQKWEFIPIFIYESNIMFSQETSIPQCSSPDAKLGRTYGLCAKCEFLPMGKQPVPFQDQKPSACNNVINVIVTDVNFQSIYEIPFSKSSHKAGFDLRKLVKKAGGNAWKKAFQLSSELRTNPETKKSWWVLKCTPTSNLVTGEHARIARALYHFIYANRMLALGQFYSRVSANGDSTIRATERDSGLDAELLGGLAGGADGEEPTDAPPASSGSVRNNNSSPM